MELLEKQEEVLPRWTAPAMAPPKGYRLRQEKRCHHHAQLLMTAVGSSREGGQLLKDGLLRCLLAAAAKCVCVCVWVRTCVCEPTYTRAHTHTSTHTHKDIKIRSQFNQCFSLMACAF